MYNVRAVTENVWWVGGNDRRLPLFENIHPIPRGVSYNAYVLLDEKAVLFDTVDWSACRQFLENIEHVLSGRTLDYLVVDHVEPDHAASLQEVLKRWPDVQVVATAAAFKLLTQFNYHIAEDRRVVVKDGDSLSFGAHTVTFLTAPMVHWPEVMVSFDATAGILYSADAFGTFGALNGKLFDDELDFERDWLPDARRYYANIVGKYGVQVQTLLKKVAPLADKIKFICALHGPVWRTNIGWYLDKYDKWSRYEPEEKGVLVIYGSMYGNTEAAADALCVKLTERGVREVAMYDASSTNVSQLIAETFRLSHVVVAGPTYNGGVYPPILDYLEDAKGLFVQNRTFAVIENGSWGCALGRMVDKFVTEELKNCSVLPQKLTLASTLHDEQADSLDALADALCAAVKG